MQVLFKFVLRWAKWILWNETSFEKLHHIYSFQNFTELWLASNLIKRRILMAWKVTHYGILTEISTIK